MRKFVAVLGSAAVLFTQVAMAAHACVTRALDDAATSMAMSQPSHESSPCAAMEGERINHCQQHCDSAQQSLDHAQPASFMPALVEIYRIELTDPHVVPHANGRHLQALLARSTAPPLAVQYCCFRT
jgi:hypothetical protein